MRAYRFVAGPEKLKIPYEPFGDFAEGIRAAAVWFLERHGECPNACYVSVGFPDGLPGVMFLRDEDGLALAVLQFRRQTLLGEDEILLGVEVEIDLWEGNDERFTERAIG